MKVLAMSPGITTAKKRFSFKVICQNFRKARFRPFMVTRTISARINHRERRHMNIAHTHLFSKFQIDCRDKVIQEIEIF